MESRNEITGGEFSGPVVQARTIGSIHFGTPGAASVPIEDAIRDLGPVLAAVLDNDFTGRQWVISEIDRFLHRRPSGYLWIEAEAGMGKSALAAHLVRERGWVGHFARLPRGGSVRAGLQNLAGRLIDRYELWELAPGRMVPEHAFTPEGFARVLSRAADRARAAGELLVLVADGADEAEPVEGTQPWGLPGDLPPGVFVVGTYRTGSPPPRGPVAPVVVSIRPSDARNHQDVTSYLESVVRQEDLAGRLAEAGVSPAEFTRRLGERCGGVWVYLRYVLSDIREGIRDPRRLDDLPADLSSYYLVTLDRWSRHPRWHDGLLPLLATLVAGGEPLPVPQLARLSGVDEPSVRSWCHTVLRPFLAAVLLTRPAREAAVRGFEIYHAGMRELLTGARPRDGDPDQEWMWSEVLGSATMAAHNRIADHYLSVFGGLTAELPSLAADPALATDDDSYPLRHLARHLTSAGRAADLHRLLWAEHRSGPGRAVNVWFAAHDRADTVDGYLADLATARQDTELHTGHALARELGYRLMGASVLSLTTALPVPLLTCLLEQRAWTGKRAVAHARRLTDPAARARALAALAPHLPAHTLPSVTTDVLAAAAAITDRSDRVEVLAMVTPYLTDDQRAAVVADVLPDSVHTRTLGFSRVRALRELAPYLSADQLAATVAVIVDEYDGAAVPEPKAFSSPGALAAVWASYEEHDRAEILEVLLPHLPDDRRAAVVRQVLAAAVNTRVFEFPYTHTLVALAPYLSDEQLAERMAAAGAVADESVRAHTLTTLLPHVPTGHRAEVLADAVAAATAIADGNDRVKALAELVPQLAVEPRKQVLDTALAAAIGIPDASLGAHALSHLLPYLPAGRRDAVVEELWAFLTTGAERFPATLLGRLAPYLSPDQFAEAWAVVISTVSPEDHDRFFSELAPCLSAGQLTEVLVTTNSTGNAAVLAETLARLAAHLPADERGAVIADAVAVASGITVAYFRARALAGLFPHLPAERLPAIVSEALAARKASTFGYDRARGLASWVSALPAELRTPVLSEALAAATVVTDLSTRGEALVEVIPHLPPSRRRNAVVARTLAIATGDVHPVSRGRILVGLAPYLSAKQLAKALTAARTITGEHDRTEALMALASRLPAGQRAELIAETVTAAAAVADEATRAWMLAEVIPHLPTADERAAVVAEALATAGASSTDEFLRSRILVGVAPYLSAEQVAEVLATAPTAYHAEVLEAVLPHLSPDQLVEAMAAISRQNAPFLGPLLLGRAEELWGAGPGYLSLLRSAVRSADRDTCLAVVGSCAPGLRALAGPEFAAEVIAAVHAVHRWWP